MSDAAPYPFPASSSAADARPSTTARLAPLSASADPTPSNGETEASTKPPGRVVYEKRKEFLDHMLRSLDIMVYTHISYLYLLDCSMLRVIISSAIQLWALTPKLLTPSRSPFERPSILYSIIFATCYSLIYHVLTTAPDSSEEVHHYLHGGILIDFIGQRGPISKTRLVLVDLFIFVLQLFQLSVIVAKIETPSYATITRNSREGPQDMEAEERGERRAPIYYPDGSLRRRESGEGREERDESASPTFSMTPEAERERRELEVKRRSYQITSGEFQVMVVDVGRLVRRIWGGGRTVGDAETRGGGHVDMEAGGDGERVVELIRRG
ncbi:DUF1746-domain-containing protein, partial [Ascodesmis nigricans]